jgi:hypothetical protein
MKYVIPGLTEGIQAISTDFGVKIFDLVGNLAGFFSAVGYKADNTEMVFMFRHS